MPPHGIIPPIVTPFAADESLDLPRLRKLIDRLLTAGVHGIFVLGTTGEFYALDEEEKRAVIAEAVAHVNGRVPVYAGTGAASTREAVRLTQMAERMGVAGVSVITPFYIAPSQTEIADHFRVVAESTGVGVILYANPSTCGGLRIAPETVTRLAELPNVIGVKDSSGDLDALAAMVRMTPPGFAVLQGWDRLLHAALEAGAAGAVPGTANVAPELAVGLYAAHRSGDAAAAAECQARLSPIRLALQPFTSPGGIKAAMDALGVPAGPSRRPIGRTTPDQRAKLLTALREAGLLDD